MSQGKALDKEKHNHHEYGDIGCDSDHYLESFGKHADKGINTQMLVVLGGHHRAAKNHPCKHQNGKLISPINRAVEYISKDDLSKYGDGHDKDGCP